MSFLTSTLGLPASHLRVDVHAQGDMAHYARASADIQFLFPQGWAELWGVANRGDYDLRYIEGGRRKKRKGKMKNR